MGYAKSAFAAITAEDPEPIAARHEKELVARTRLKRPDRAAGFAAVRSGARLRPTSVSNRGSGALTCLVEVLAGSGAGIEVIGPRGVVLGGSYGGGSGC